MAEQPRTRQELYDRIRSSSKDEVILEEMIRLGFWPPENSLPEDPADEIRRRAELEKELRAYRSEFARLNDETALRKELRKRRLQESREKQAANRERRLRERARRAEEWRARKEREIFYLGAGVSGGLGRRELDEEARARLASAELPVLSDAAGIAAAMGITPGELRFLAYQRKTAVVSHYVRFRLPKKTGGERIISAPKPRLKKAQRWILTNILEKNPVHDAGHGFRPGRSILSNARAHPRSRLVVNVDLKDFFPAITFRRVKGMFQGLGYGEEAATIFALLTTAGVETELELDGRTYYVSDGERVLPQGSPASPAITNLICRRLDRRLAGMAAGLGFRYTRYADDLTFSAPVDTGVTGKRVAQLLGRTRGLCEAEGFSVHPRKTRVLHSGRRQEITGLVVNDRPAVPRKTLRKFRALLFQIEKDGPDGKRWGPSPHLFASLRGFARYVAMVRPEKGGALGAEVERLAARYENRA